MESCRSRQILVNLAYPYSACHIFSQALTYFVLYLQIRFFFEIRLDELEFFPAGLEEDLVKFRDRHSRGQRI